MANDPDQCLLFPYFPRETYYIETLPSQESHMFTTPKRSPSGEAAPTQYKFIMQSGDESVTAAKQKLKTVRSHVMKNYLQQQQRQARGSGDSSLLAANSERRSAKQLNRLSRSRSPSSPVVSEGGRSATADIGSLFSGFSSSSLFPGYDPTIQSSGHQQPSALDFGYEAQKDEISMTAQLYVSSLIHDKKTGFLEPSFDTLNAKLEIVRIVKDALGADGNEIPQSTIFAVSLLAFGCAVDSEWDQATGHIEALQRLLSARGGVESVDFELRRLFTWTTYCVASALRLPAVFTPPTFKQVDPFPLAFIDDAQIRAWRTVKRFPKSNNSFIFDIVVRLHQLGQATSSEWYSSIDQHTLSNLFFESMYNIIGFSSQEPWTATLPNGPQGREILLMFKVWVEGLPLFVWATTRHAKSRAGLMVTRCSYDQTFSRVRSLLEGSGGCHAWPRGKGLEPVLATLFYCAESCDFANPWRPWVLDTMRRVIGMLKLKTLEEFKKILEFFLSTDEYSRAADDLWRETMQGAMMSSPPMLTFSTI